MSQGSWTEITDPEAHAQALRLARGSYQRGIIMGVESLSGSTLKGKAVDYIGRYRNSARNLLPRLTEAGVKRSVPTISVSSLSAVRS